MTKEQEAIELEWQRLLFKLRPNLGKKPSMEAVLMLIGVQEFGQVHRAFSKEEKEDLMHIGTCTVLQVSGYYHFSGLDEDGWPHYDPTDKKLPTGLDVQETLIKQHIIRYFEEENEKDNSN